jgi:formylglycine-generating enzyme required for sulfatase activity
MKTRNALTLLLTSLGLFVTVARAAPAIISYAGHVNVDGQPFAGQGKFKFAFVNGSGQLSYWSNDGASSAGSEPSAHVTTTVTNGNYTVLLGDTSLSGMGAIDAAVFQNHNDAHLRVWFDDGTNGFQLLSPDRRFASVPYLIGNDGNATANFSSSGGDANGTSAVTMAGGYVRLVADGPAGPSSTLVLLDGDTADLVAYVGEATGLLEYSFGEHSFVLPKTFDSFRQTLIGPGSVRLIAPTGSKTFANLRVFRAGGRDNLDLQGGAPAGSQVPAIVSIPTQRTVVIGGATTLFVSASGDNLTYQWKKNGVNVPGATSADLVFASAASGDSGSYAVRVANADGNVTSAAAQLVVDTLMKTVPTAVYVINADPDNAGHEVALSSYMIDMYETRMSYWVEIYDWATQNGYAFTNPGLNVDPDGIPQSGDHPVHSVSWHDVLKWANARSEKDGFTPCYYVDVNRTQVYRSGEVEVDNFKVDWTASGYRLPTEAEWEVAARGGLASNKYSWGNSPFPSKANYLDTQLGKPTAAGTFGANGYGIHDVDGNLREWVWDWDDDRTYEYEFKEDFPDADGSYDLVDEQNSTAFYESTTDEFMAGYVNFTEVPSTSPYNWTVRKALILDLIPYVTEVRNQLKCPYSNSNYKVRCKMKFYYSDGTDAESTELTESSVTYVSKGPYTNPNPGKPVNKIEVLMKHGGTTSAYKGYERNTEVYSNNPSQDYYVTLDLPQYKEQNATHFRVKVDADREGDDDIWFELVDESNATKLYANTDLDQILPITAPIVNPKKLRIYLKQKSSNPSPTGTALKAVYWTTNDPKSLWSGSERVTKDGAFSDDLRLLKYRSSNAPSHIGATKGFRLARRP